MRLHSNEFPLQASVHRPAVSGRVVPRPAKSRHADESCTLRFVPSRARTGYVLTAQAIRLLALGSAMSAAVRERGPRQSVNWAR
jgi:hypothetical protein